MQEISKNSVIVCLSSDSNYEPHLWVTIASMIENAKTKVDYNLFILDGGIKDKEAFYSLIESDSRFHIEFIDMRDQFKTAFESRHLSKAAYYRLAILKLFKDYKRVVYIDADSYILGDVAQLANVPMGRKSIAGALDSITYDKKWREKYISYKKYSGKAIDYFLRYLKLSSTKLSNYFSSGVLVFNIENTDVEKKIKKMEYLLENSYFCHDQDIFNLLFSEKETYLLDRVWNYFNSTCELKAEDFVDKKEKKNYLGNSVKPKIISYVTKPWEKEYVNSKFADLYWAKLKQSPYYLDVLAKSQKSQKLKRFLKLSLREKVRILTSPEIISKYKGLLKR